jgi:hypothetical protein
MKHKIEIEKAIAPETRTRIGAVSDETRLWVYFYSAENGSFGRSLAHGKSS